MKWLYKWLGEKIRHSESDVWLKDVAKSDILVSSDSTMTRRDSMNFRIHRASGGMVVVYNHYDRKTDEEHEAIHIITDQQDLGEQLSKIITIEMLRR